MENFATAWTFPGGKRENQIDHITIARKWTKGQGKEMTICSLRSPTCTSKIKDQVQNTQRLFPQTSAQVQHPIPEEGKKKEKSEEFNIEIKNKF
jgi:hypothetical protein